MDPDPGQPGTAGDRERADLFARAALKRGARHREPEALKQSLTASEGGC